MTIKRTRMRVLEPIRRSARTLILVTALIGAGCAQPPAYQVYNQPAPRTGVVESIRQVDRATYPSGAGAVAGALVGGGLGTLIGGGTGRTAAIILGAVGGGLVGNEMQKSQRELLWEIGIRYDDGGYGTITQTQAPALRIGDRARVTDTGIELMPRR
jgi:outer membrane lipoprotein SlyB